MAPRGHPHLKGDSFFRYYTCQYKEPIKKPKKKNCKDKILDYLAYFFKSK